MSQYRESNFLIFYDTIVLLKHAASLCSYSVLSILWHMLHPYTAKLGVWRIHTRWCHHKCDLSQIHISFLQTLIRSLESILNKTQISCSLHIIRDCMHRICTSWTDLTSTPSSIWDGSFYLKWIRWIQIPTQIFQFLADMDQARSLAPASVFNQSTSPGQLLNML